MPREPSEDQGGTPQTDQAPDMVLVTRVELETLVARVEALEEALDAIANRST
jgi:BMFP domain-containing protein YqiC